MNTSYESKTKSNIKLKLKCLTCNTELQFSRRHNSTCTLLLPAAFRTSVTFPASGGLLGAEKLIQGQFAIFILHVPLTDINTLRGALDACASSGLCTPCCCGLLLFIPFSVLV